MIDLQFASFWSGGQLSYLRYLTFKTLRYHHPFSKISLFVSKTYNKSDIRWDGISHDFNKQQNKDYVSELINSLKIDVIYCDIFSDFHPNFQSDLFKWWWLSNNSGFYIDTDIIFLKPFDTLPLNRDLIFSKYDTKSMGTYTPVSIIGSSGDSKSIKYAKDNVIEHYNSKDYNCLGSSLFKQVISMNFDNNVFNTPSVFFNAIPEPFMNEIIFRNPIKLSDMSYALHWYGGNTVSNEFDNVYTEEYSKNSSDTITEIVNKFENKQ